MLCNFKNINVNSISQNLKRMDASEVIHYNNTVLASVYYFKYDKCIQCNPSNLWLHK